MDLQQTAVHTKQAVCDTVIDRWAFLYTGKREVEQNRDSRAGDSSVPSEKSEQELQ